MRQINFQAPLRGFFSAFAADCRTVEQGCRRLSQIATRCRVRAHFWRSRQKV